ncbi:hypothetical protein HPB49_015378 [Dermacentor silvarum]|uniref:Uncharacterized protein n=1 Tax=Dermacentor silvarum TaxID=543639 RepID=A0ACB8DJG7_DERSI|nr:hypothetical protein HPB49_015378 [Dermacentor silvarum]
MSQHSSSSYGYDQRPLLVTPLSGKYQATPLANRLEDAPTNFSSDSGMVADSEDYWGTSPTLPDLLHGPVESNPVVMAVLDGEKVVNHCAKPNNENTDELAASAQQLPPTDVTLKSEGVLPCTIRRHLQ